MENDNKNTGLCVGGPLDGRRCECNGPVLHAAQTVSLGEANFEQTTQRPVGVYTIRHIRTANMAPGECYDLWVPEDATLEWAMEKLYSTYHNVGGSV